MTKVIATGISLPPLTFSGKVVIVNYASSGTSVEVDGNTIVTQQSPCTLRAPGLPDFTFPVDPFIGMQLRNIITRRRVAKGTKRGTVKERWTEDDVEINISGVLQGADQAYPADAVAALQRYFEYRGAIEIVCAIVNDRNVQSIVIENFELPHTKGGENQAYQIKAYSDDVFDLLIDNNNV
jgi:hypothetical protein